MCEPSLSTVCVSMHFIQVDQVYAVLIGSIMCNVHFAASSHWQILGSIIWFFGSVLIDVHFVNAVNNVNKMLQDEIRLRHVFAVTVNIKFALDIFDGRYSIVYTRLNVKQ